MVKQFHLGLTNICNMRCSHCFVKNKKIQNINEKKVLELIRTLENKGLTHIYYTYGEPLMYPNFFDIVEQIKEMGIFQVLMTNGSLITEEMAKKIAISGINKVMVSLDSSNELKHDTNRRFKGAYKLALKAISNLKNYKVYTGIATTVTEDNKDDLIEIEKIGRKLNVDVHSFLALRNENKIISTLSEQYLHLFNNAVINNKNYNFHDYRLLDILLDMKKNNKITKKQFDKYCGLNSCLINENLSISPTGEVYKCNFINDKAIANLEINSINEIIKKLQKNCKGCSHA